jgi:hypothetical protein
MRNACRLGLVLGIGIALVGATAETPLATPVDPEILEQIGPRATNPGRNKKDLVERGRKLFFEETFDGNGRTCGTCHPATNNFTIDPAFIAKLPQKDPLFVAEFNPDLKELENPRLMRRFGLILENLDGFDKPGVMRAVPHNLAMPTSIHGELDGRTHALGWSGDGSPDDGSLRMFTLGAIVQHFPRTLNREEGVDFRLPTDGELDAMEAFMMSVGRRQDVDLAVMTFADERVERGRLLFNNEDDLDDRGCASCHADAGANDEGINKNFDTGTRHLTRRAPPDGGFGTDQRAEGGYGDGTMNTPPLIEAADTAPFFHNHSAKTLEEAITFYTSKTFANSPSGEFGTFDFDRDDIEAIGALLRTLNAMENIRYSNVLSDMAQRSVPKLVKERIREVIAETEDAIQVLTKGPVSLYRETVAELRRALKLEKDALKASSTSKRNALLRAAACLKSEAGSMMVAE